MTDQNYRLVVVKCHGQDADSFLNGQFSNDVSSLQAGEFQRNAYCNPKGRVLALVGLVKLQPGEYYLLLPEDLAEATIRRLRMFVMRAKVQFEELPDLSVSPIENSSIGPGRAESTQDGVILNWGLTGHRCCLIASGDNQPLPSEWLAADIREGIPQVFASTSEMFLPQAINLDLVNAVSFTKGCYPGQEIVARLKYLGKLKQRMMRFSSDENQVFPLPGEPLLAGEKKIGEIVSVQGGGDQPIQGLAVVTIAKRDEDAIQLTGNTSVALELPPYSVPEFESDTSQ